MKKQLLFGFVFLFVFLFIGTISATIVFNPTSLNLDLKCGVAGRERINLVSGVPANCIISLSMDIGLDGLFVGFYNTEELGNGADLYIQYAVDKNTCEAGQETIDIDVCGTIYQVNVNVDKTGSPIFSDRLYKDEKINIGDEIELILLEIFETGGAKYRLIGCDEDKNRESLDVNESETYECNDDTLVVKLIRVSSSYVIFDISASTNWATSVSESDESDYDSGDCVLGFSTGGFLVKRGQSLIGTTINSKTGEYRPNVIVKIVDPMAEIPMVTIQSDQFGSIQQPLSDKYKGLSLALSLSMPIDSTIECIASTNNKVDFDKTYTDYLKEKAEEEGKYQLVLNMSARYELGAISNTIKNELGEVIEGATVRITKPDNSYIDITTNSLGVFSFTPTQIGKFSIQASKDEYTPSVMNEIEIFQNKNYLIVIKVNGESKSEYKSGDELSFELRDENNTLLTLSIDATFAGLPIKFVSGISDKVTFEDTAILNIPAVDGYTTQTITLNKKENNLGTILYWIGIIIGIIVALFVLGLIIRKFKGGEKQSQKMEFQLGGGE